MHFLTAYIDQYGYFFLALALMLELLAFPLPGEVIMSYAGFLAFQGKLSWAICLLTGMLGASIGMTIAYLVGFKLGMPFFRKYGRRFHLGPDRLEKTSKWFSKYGNKLLLIAYFIPGVRHFTGYFSGVTRISFRTYATYAYSGAFLWVVTFISIGKILGPSWQQFHESIKKYFIIASIIIGILFICIYVYRKYQNEFTRFTESGVRKSLKLFRTRRRAWTFLLILSIVTIGFIILMGGMIQDFIAGEFKDFNTISAIVVSSIFGKKWAPIMRELLYLGSNKILIIVIAFSIGIILVKEKEKLNQLLFYLFVMIGGEIYEEIVRAIFHRFAPIDMTMIDRFSFNFPSEQSLMAFVIYGYFVFELVRHSRRIWFHSFGIILFLTILLILAISRIFYTIQEPSQVAAGYVFGGVWLGLCVLLFEMNRIFKTIA